MSTRIVFSIFAIVFGATAAVLPDADNDSMELNERMLHQEMLLASNYITVDELAQYLIAQDPSIRLIDVRPPREFGNDPLPGAVNIPLDSIFSENWNYYLDQTAMKNILYGEKDMRATQVWTLARQKGYQNNYILKGGLEAWENNILNPVYPESTAPQSAFDLYQQRAAASRYFTGSDKVIQSAPTAPVIPIQRKKKEKVQGGCS
jgi:rhodanese-related sulfurtransferase